jgi:uncharacterized protein YyaL (SSP411 family)
VNQTGIDWLPWGEEAFARARSEGRPVLLHIGATWCHWCHVMDEGTYPDPRVVALVNARFVAIRVDTDQRPDLNDRYNQGGWPTCAVLDPSGDVLVGRLYMPAHELLPLLESCSQPGQRWVLGAPPEADLIDASASPEAVWAAVRKAWDPWHAGFGELEKFPHPGVLDWLADRAAAGHAEAADMLDRTLDAMADKGLHDPVDGGFFRYATRDDWGEVHDEKLGEDQARLLRVYLRRDRQRAAAERTVAWVVRHLWRDDVGAFAGSMDADGPYYGSPARGEPPRVDPIVVAGWNAQLAITFVRAACAWDRPGLAALALAAMTHVRDQLVGEDGAVLRNAGGVAGLLEEQAAVADAAAVMGQFTGDAAWIELAGRVLGFADSLALAEGGFRDGPAGGIGLLRFPRRLLPPNAALGEAAWRLAALTDDPRWSRLAAEASRGATLEADRYGFMAAPAAALAERLGGRTVVVKVRDNPALLAELWGRVDPGVVVRRVHDGPEGAALVCSARACSRPVGRVADVLEQVSLLRG